MIKENSHHLQPIITADLIVDYNYSHYYHHRHLQQRFLECFGLLPLILLILFPILLQQSLLSIIQSQLFVSGEHLCRQDYGFKSSLLFKQQLVLAAQEV